ncbi:FIST C-terminal domain-containing protein [Halomonas janggokensis]|uniref:FIST C-terminal domain-containing protein n=1 Tax=Vreelandella janggokensis TaxID=370767 RepID=A0ABT4IVY1_9GAMM|nr:nitric oxide-sensing protein NosP [Halomonas janggokensis]MCZ0927837.1 FIST C-terminal domain-containing protein [Halomonas janggokensis]MCZ0930705.1 FIST C-terminal domain-containing protein [Halomonas janggokensis]
MTTSLSNHGTVVVASRSANAEQAVQVLAEGLSHADLGGVIFFCSAEYDLERLSAALVHAFPAVPVSGCTTAGEITPEGYDRGSIVAIGFDHRVFAMETSLVNDLDRFALSDAQPLVDDLIERCRRRALAPVNEHSFALTLLDGLSSREEQVLATLDAALGRIPSFGGSAGDDNHLANTHVYANGRFHSRAAVVVMINTCLPFEVFSTHHLLPLSHKLVVTEADRERRRVMELNALPAASVYADLVGVSLDALVPEVFARHPLAVQLGGQHFVRSIQRVNDDGSLNFYCAVENGIVLTAMQPAPLLDDLNRMLDGVTARLGPPSLMIGCDCFLRRMELEAVDHLEQASALLRRSRVVGFNTYGEQHHGMHVNQTFTGVALGTLPALDG